MAQLPSKRVVIGPTGAAAASLSAAIADGRKAKAAAAAEPAKPEPIEPAAADAPPARFDEDTAFWRLLAAIDAESAVIPPAATSAAASDSAAPSAAAPPRVGIARLAGVELELVLLMLGVDGVCRCTAVSRRFLQAASRPNVWRRWSHAESVQACGAILVEESNSRYFEFSQLLAGLAVKFPSHAVDSSRFWAMQWTASSLCRRYLPIVYEAQTTVSHNVPHAAVLADMARFGNIRLLKETNPFFAHLTTSTEMLPPKEALALVQQRGMQSLNGYKIRGTHSTPETLACVLRSPNLTHLKLVDPDRHGMQSEWFASAHKLRRVNLTTSLSAQDMLAFGAIPHLERLSIKGDTWAALDPRIMPCLRNLTHLDLTNVKARSIAHGADRRISNKLEPAKLLLGDVLAGMSRLTYLSIENSNLESVAALLVELQTEGRLPPLRVLRWWDNNWHPDIDEDDLWSEQTRVWLQLCLDKIPTLELELRLEDYASEMPGILSQLQKHAGKKRVRQLSTQRFQQTYWKGDPTMYDAAALNDVADSRWL